MATDPAQPSPQTPGRQSGWWPATIIGAVVLLGGGWWIWSVVGGDEYAVGKKIQLAPDVPRGGVRQLGDVLRSLGNPATRPARNPARSAPTSPPATGPAR